MKKLYSRFKQMLSISIYNVPVVWIKQIKEHLSYFEQYTIMGCDDLVLLLTLLMIKFFFLILAFSFSISILWNEESQSSQIWFFMLILSIYFFRRAYLLDHIQALTSNNRIFLEVLIAFITINFSEKSYHLSFLNIGFCYFLWFKCKNYILVMTYSIILIISELDGKFVIKKIMILILYNLVYPAIFHFIIQFSYKIGKNFIEKIKLNFSSMIKQQNVIFASMTHDLRNPICSQINTLEDLIESKNINQKERNAIKIASFSAKLQLNLINNILDFAKIESGKFDINLVPVNIKDLFSQLLNIEKRLAIKKGLFLKITIISCPREEVMGDPNRISQIIMNLVGNSIKFTSDGGVEVIIRWITNFREFNECFVYNDHYVKRHSDIDCSNRILNLSNNPCIYYKLLTNLMNIQ